MLKTSSRFGQSALFAAALGLVLSACTGSTGAPGADGTSCSLVNNGDGTATITCGTSSYTVNNGVHGATGPTGAAGATGATGTAGSDGTSCTIADNLDLTATITCGTTQYVVHAGAAGATGATGAAGATGATGAGGATGATGATGPVTTTNESCMVCHTAGRDFDPNPAVGSTEYGLSPKHTLAYATGTQDNVVVSAVSVANVSGKMAISFHVANSLGAVANVGNGDIRVFFAEITSPAEATTSNYLRRWGYERTGTYTVATVVHSYPFGTLTNLTGGNYTYTTVADVPTMTTPQRIFLRVGKTGMNTGNATYDFLAADVATPLADSRAIVPTAACNACHVDRIADHGHGGGYNQTGACVVCHSPLLDETGLTDTPHDMQALGFDFPTMIHQAHGSITAKNPWSVTFPAKMDDCKVCHTGGAQSDNYKNKPSRMACGSCHTTVDFVTGTNHPSPGGVQLDDTGCKFCHNAAYVDLKHDPTFNKTAPATGQTMNNVPEFQVTIAMDAPASGTFYVAGETPTITVTLKNFDGSAVDPTIYTNAKHTAGTTVANTLSKAALYVYGPRTHSKPVLTKGAAVTPTPTQSTSLFTAGAVADPNILTDSTGFKYKLNAIPAGLTGTFFVRFIANNYGYVSDTNYITDSNAMTSFQIGTATVDLKVAGDCMRCHGTRTAPFHDARHNVQFDTDQCLSCHDQSGNHADAISNRVHAVHSASKLGDILAIDWSAAPNGPLNYPVGAKNGDVRNCSVCHSSGNGQYKVNAVENACMGCHADAPGALDHFRQNGGKF
jgi:hypothetical protein